MGGLRVCGWWRAAALVGAAATVANLSLVPPALRHMAAHLVQDLGGRALNREAYRLLGGVLTFADTTLTLVKPARPPRGYAHVVRTARDSGERLAVLAPVRLEPGPLPQEQPAVIVDPSRHYQTFLGFGGAFTETSAELFKGASPANQERLLQAYFHPEFGLGYTFGRLHMNSCDFSAGNWSCADVPGDTALESFSVQRYEGSILPMVRRAGGVAGRNLSLLASPWSPPAWMKDTGRMSTGGKLLPEYRGPWARFFVRFAQELRAAGLPLWGFTVQNEPDATTAWENCNFSAEEERDFVRDHLGPALEGSGLGLKLVVWDHNRHDMFLRAQTIYGDPEAARHVWGVGYHWYGDPRYEYWADRNGMVGFEALQHVHELRPGGHIVMTEACQEAGPRIGDWRLGERYGESIIRDLNHWLEAWIDWNLLLDEAGGPNHADNRVSAPVILDTARGRLLYLSSYYYIGHFSRYIRPGARRIGVVSNRDALEATGFANPDGTVAVVVMNQGMYWSFHWISYAGARAQVVAPPHSITTYILNAE